MRSSTMKILNEINIKANEKTQMAAMITEGEELVIEIEQFLKKNKYSLQLKEAIGRTFTDPNERTVSDPGAMGDVMSDLNQESDKMSAIKSRLVSMADKLNTIKDSAQRTELFKKISIYANKAGIDPHEIFGITPE